MTLIVGSQELCKWKHLTIYHHSTKCKFIVKVKIIKKIVPKLNRHSGWSQSCHCCWLTAPGPPVFLISGARGVWVYCGIINTALIMSDETLLNKDEYSHIAAAEPPQSRHQQGRTCCHPRPLARRPLPQYSALSVSVHQYTQYTERIF